MEKRILSLFMALCMILTLVPAAWADELAEAVPEAAQTADAVEMSETAPDGEMAETAGLDVETVYEIAEPDAESNETVQTDEIIYDLAAPDNEETVYTIAEPTDVEENTTSSPENTNETIPPKKMESEPIKFEYTGEADDEFFIMEDTSDNESLLLDSLTVFDETASLQQTITIYTQTDSRWASYHYKFSGSNNYSTIKEGGCGLLAYTNAVYYLNGSFIDPTILAEFSAANGCHVSGGTTTALYKKFADSRGSAYGISFVGDVLGYDKLKQNLGKGYVATCHCDSSVGGHIMAIVDYDVSNGKYLLLDSNPSTARGTSNGYVWKTASQLDAIGMRSNNSLYPFHIIRSTKAPINYTVPGRYRVTDSSLNMRNGAGVENALIDVIPNGTLLDVTQKSDSGWGYTSYNGKNGWVALNYCEYVGEIPVPAVDLGADFYAYIASAASGRQLFAQDDGNVTSYLPTGTLHQIWHFERLENNFYKITSAYNGASLDVENYGTASGTNLHMVGYAGNSAQTWYFREVNSGQYLLGAQCTSCVVDITNASLDGQNAYMCQEYRNENQVFTIQKTEMLRTVDLGFGTDFYGYLVNANGSRLTVYDDGNVVSQNSLPEFNFGQIWHFEKLDNNRYRIISVKNGAALDVVYALGSQGTNVGTAGWNDGSAQKWSFYSVSSGQFVVTADCTLCVLDNGGGSDTNVYMNTETVGNWCQWFTVQKIEFPQLDINGWLDGNDAGSLGDYGTLDVYINGERVRDGTNDYCERLAPGTRYEIRDIRPNPGCSYNGLRTGSLSGVIGSDNIDIRLNFSRVSFDGITKTAETTSSSNIYQYYSTPVTWYTAKAFCEAQGGHLVTISSAEENDIVRNLTGYAESVWIGGTDIEEEQNWKWVTGEPFSYAPWLSGEPNNVMTSPYEYGENYLELRGDGTWNDYPGCCSKPFVCEIEVEATAAAVLNGHMYYYYAMPLTWYMAKQFCENQGGHLVTISSVEENRLVRSSGNGDIWLGGSDAGQEGTWKWVTGETFGDFERGQWCLDEPNNAGNNDEGCENYLSCRDDGGWNDCPGYFTIPFICEFDRVSSGGIEKLNGHVYRYYSTPMTWYAAKEFCEGQGGHLVTVASSAENQLILDLSGHKEIWLGGSDAEEEENWKWVTGETFIYDNWNDGEPNNAGNNDEGAENYLRLLGDGSWNDYPGYMQAPFVCEIEAVQVPVTGVRLDVHKLELNGFPYMRTFSVTISPENASNQTLRWASSDESVAYVHGNGILMVKKTGRAVITVTTEDGGYTDTCEVIISKAVTGVSLNTETLSLEAGSSGSLHAVISPSDAGNQNVKWTSSNTSVAVVSGNGTEATVTACSVGSATVTAATEDGNKTAVCSVTVTAKPVPERTLVSIGIARQPNKTVYKIGETWDGTGLAIKTNYSDSTSEALTSGFTVSGFSSANAGTKTVTVTYQGKTAAFTVTVRAEDNLVDPDAPQIVIENQTVSPGATFTVPVLLKNNPGIAAFGLEVLYDTKYLEQTAGGQTKDIPDVAFSPETGSPYQISLGRMSNFTDSEAVVAVLPFRVKEGVTSGSVQITVSLKEDGEPYNEFDEEVNPFELISGTVVIQDYMPGDANGDGKVTPRDATRVLQYYNGWDVTINRDAADANGDGKVTPRDATRVLQYYNGWNVTLGKTQTASLSDAEISLQDAAPLQFAIENQTVSPGSTFEVPVLLKNNPGIAGFGLEISYDTDILQLTGDGKTKDIADVTFS